MHEKERKVFKICTHKPHLFGVSIYEEKVLLSSQKLMNKAKLKEEKRIKKFFLF